jgi:hypothetical protein
VKIITNIRSGSQRCVGAPRQSYNGSTFSCRQVKFEQCSTNDRTPLARMLLRVMGVLFRKVMCSQHHGLVGLCLFFEELTRRSLFNDFPQPHKLIYALICLHVTPTFKIVHRCGAESAQNYFALIEQSELNDRPIEVVTPNLSSLQRHCKCSISEGLQPLIILALVWRVWLLLN